MRRARVLEEALTLLAQPPGAWRPFAGGTDLMVLLAAGTLRQEQFVSIWGIPDLRRIEVTDTAVYVGALTTFSDVLRSETLRSEFPLLCRAASETGGVANQNRGTIGGNIANASPAADTPPALLAYDAELDIVSVRGRRTVPYDGFHTGYKRMALMPDELIAGVRLPRRPGWIQHYRKVGPRRAQAISKVCFAGTARVDDGRIADIRLGFAAVAPTVVRAARAEEALRRRQPDRTAVEAALEALRSDLAPIDDIRSTARYRAHVAGALLREFLDAVAASVQGPPPAR